ncbi:MAG: SdpI family protein [Saprospiraceae bacterium]|nr:SdpI family protein [Saprospiraceae bacterium]
MKFLYLKNLILVMFLAAPLIYLNMVYDILPEKVALHFGADMQPDRYGPKSELWTTILMLMGIALVAYLLVTNLSKIDPKNQNLQSQGIIEKLGLTIVGFMSLITLYIIYSSYNPTSGKLLIVMLGGLFAVLGNFMNSIKPNYFVGFRLPWTLENEDNWRKTHQLGGKVWVAGGLLIALLTFLLPAALILKLLFVIISIMVLVPAIYSYRHYRQSKIISK